MGDLSEHFSREEFACQCGCGFDTVDAELITVLESVRELWNEPVTITSGCRCSAHNLNSGGSTNSQHRLGRAADILVSGVDPRDVASWLRRRFTDRLGIGDYDGFTHVDSRSGVARWDG
jgi:uncharacterized protein YcbK (DUF882 family)